MAEISASKPNGTSNGSSSCDGMITAAEMIRKKRMRCNNNNNNMNSDPTVSSTATKPSRTTSINDIDDEIQRLERELQQGSDDDESNDDDSENEEEDGVNDKATMILSISESKQNPIEKLPTHCLPPSLTLSKLKSKGGSKKRTCNEDTNDTNGGTNNNNISGAGLKKAVQELIQNYQGRNSTERIPYFCRYCQHQAIDYNDFQHHQTILSHIQNVTLHNKASYCKLCSKQFNSPIQLQEHLQSKPHHEKLHYLQSKQQHRSKNQKPMYR